MGKIACAMITAEIIKKLQSYANPQNVVGMATFGINPKQTLGVSVPVLRKMAKEIGKDHQAAIGLWQSGIHEARILASMVDDPWQVTEEQAEHWVSDFDSWDVCDQVCMNLFDKTSMSFAKASQWARREKEFEKRAGFALMAVLAWHDKQAPDSSFLKFFPLIKAAASDERNFVKKAVNWALRQIGKRNSVLRRKAIELAEEIEKLHSRTARWIARDALRELRSSKC